MALKLFCIIVFLLMGNNVFSQTENKRGPCGGNITTVIISKGIFFNPFTKLDNENKLKDCYNLKNIFYINRFKINDSLLLSLRLKNKELKEDSCTYTLIYNKEDSCVESILFDICTNVEMEINGKYYKSSKDIKSDTKQTIIEASMKRRFLKKSLLKLKIE